MPGYTSPPALMHNEHMIAPILAGLKVWSSRAGWMRHFTHAMGPLRREWPVEEATVDPH